MVLIHLKKSKCDQFGTGSDIVLGFTGANLCPFTALLQYIAMRGDQPGPFSLASSQEVVMKSWFVKHIRSVLNSIGLPQHLYAGHSFCIGAANTTALVGVENSTIQMLGSWPHCQWSWPSLGHHRLQPAIPHHLGLKEPIHSSFQGNHGSAVFNFLAILLDKHVLASFVICAMF